MFISLKIVFLCFFCSVYFITVPQFRVYCTLKIPKNLIPTVTMHLCKFVSILRFLCYIGAYCTGGGITWRTPFSHHWARSPLKGAGPRFETDPYFQESLTRDF
jgi:hypothetical protein